MSSDDITERIINTVAGRDYRPQQLRELARDMRVGEREQGDFHAACKALMKSGRIVLGARNAVTLPDPPGRIEGIFRGNSGGFGFVIPDTPNSHGDLYIPRGASGSAVTGDTVRARVLKRGKRRGKMLYEGRVTAVLRRGQSRFVGELRHRLGRWYVIPDGNVLHVPIVIGDPHAKNGGDADQVVVEIVQYAAEGVEARGVIVKVLGKRGEPGVDVRSIVEQYQLSGEFPEEPLEQARRSAEDYDPRNDAKNREDLRKLTVITIDPPGAKDFDDAISLSRSGTGLIELGVHIADVAHFVPQGSPLDEEARRRSNSVYLGRSVIPMLPEILSNNVCSLQERQPRLTKSVFITYDRRGQIKQARLAETVIRSTKRLTYHQAAEILDGRPGRTSAKVVALLKDMEKLTRAIRVRRRRQGMLELDLPAVELIYDKEGRAVGVEPADVRFPHKIIEMFMVEANEAVARLLAGRKIPALRRIHGPPKELADLNLQRFLRILGHELPDNVDRFAVQDLLNRVRGRPEAFPVHLAILRSMQQAEYSPSGKGHYALASEHYCHFTSPIRRYPDLTIHRLVAKYLSGVFDAPGGMKLAPSEKHLVELGQLCSANERRAEAAERELKLVSVLRLLEKYIGDEFDGIVTGVANVGVFVQLERFLVDGLLRFDHLGDDWWEVDPSRGAVMGELSGRQITVGDRLKIVVTRIDLPTRKLEVALSEPTGRKTEKKRREPVSRGRGRPTPRTRAASPKGRSARRPVPRAKRRRSRPSKR